jgi:uncharacterized membrane-anchored protein YhcB (DUF1043 family)
MRAQRSATHFAASSVALLLGLAAPLFGQVSVRQSTLNPNSQAQSEMQAREWALTHIPDEVNKHFKKEQISLFAQIREDFTRLQLVNNEMMQTVFVKRNVDLKLIAATTAEINKRAARLNENLVLPRLEHKAKNQKQDDEGKGSGLQAGLLALDGCIMSFIANPLFKQPNVVDAQLALKARHDLDLIIRLSKQLKTRLGDQYTDSTSLVAH